MMPPMPETWAATVAQPEPEREPRGIGGTDVGALLAYYNPGPELEALTKYGTAADLWLRLVHGIERPKSGPMSRGLKVEPILKAIYEREIAPVGPSPGVVWHPNGWASCSPDSLPPWAVCEWKSTTIYARKAWGKPFTSEVAPHYLPQCVWNCLLCDKPEAHLLVSFGHDSKAADGSPQYAIADTAVYVVERDRSLEAQLYEAAERFQVEHIDTRIPPRVEPRQNVRVWKRILKGEAP